MALDNAVNHAEQLRKAVEASTCHFDGTDIKVTMSFGVKILSGEYSADKNIELVDANLYQAKETGRNKVVVS